MKLDTMAPLVDTQPVFSAMVELKANGHLLDKATIRFLRAKLKKSIKELRSTAKYIEDELRAMREATKP
jgi:hypothetical protein